MAEELKLVEESGVEDQGSIKNVRSLVREYIAPIDNVRSLMKPSQLNQSSKVERNACGVEVQLVSSAVELKNAEFNTERPLEGRCSAFFRLLGLPVVGPDGSYYSPGFDPNLSTYNSPVIDKRNNIVEKIFNNQQLGDLLRERDEDVETRRAIFAVQDANSSYYALATRYIKSFNLFNTGTIGSEPLGVDKQTSPAINDRTKALENYTGQNRSTLLSPRHILKPFIVNPKMESVVNPQERLICAPFLQSKEDTLLSVGNPIKRPGIEFIIRIRLSQQDLDDVFLKQSTMFLNGQSPTGSNIEIQNTLIALSGNQNLTEVNKDKSFLDLIKDFSKTESNTLIMFNKSIRSSLEEMYNQIQKYDANFRDINFTPLPSKDGPEFGGKVTTLGSNTTASSFEQRIAALKIKDLNAQRQERALNNRIGGKEVYASTPMANLQNNFQAEIKKIENERDEIADTMLNSLAVIEMVTGEVSGLGLIDVLAVYTALWSISKESLIWLLDEESYNRLINFNPEISKEAEKLRASQVGVIGALKEFETKVSNVLSFADYYFNNLRKAPISNQSGNYR